MRSRPFCYAIVMASSLATSAGADTMLEARISVASATIVPRAEEKQMLLPGDLEYAIEVTMRCADHSDPQSLSLGVADVRNYIDLAETEDRSTVVSTVMVPGEQVAPVVTQGYCVVDKEETQTTLQIKDVLTMQLSLRCSDESIHYRSQPLSVIIECAAADENQDASSAAR